MAFVTSQAIQWLRLHTSTAGAVDSIPGHGIKIPHATDCDKKKKKHGAFAIIGGHVQSDGKYEFLDMHIPC